MPFAIKYRRVERSNGASAETLAVDIGSREEAGALVDRLAGSYPENGRHVPPIRWFRSDAGLHYIWVQPQ